jgi:hypothetical protein
MLKRIATSTMEQLATFLTAPGVAPGTPDAGAAAQVAFVGPDAGTPEAAGIFRLFRPHADPLPARAEHPVPAVLSPDSVPLPPRRPSPVAALGPDETLTLAADTRH